VAGATLSGIDPGTELAVLVAARDAAGNVSCWSAPLQVRPDEVVLTRPTTSTLPTLGAAPAVAEVEGAVAVAAGSGGLFIVDRSKDLIIRGGENIGCGAVEAALLEHPQVHEAAVYAVPDDRLGEEVGATLHCDASLSVESLREFLKDRLAQFEMPRYIQAHTVPLPRTPSGKIFKRQLRDEAVAELQAATRLNKENQA
jgi:acyl-CoA synthetase (AMP-forming)/AMP-acid ligase II